MLSRGKRDRDLHSVEIESERNSLHVYLKQKAESVVLGEYTAQKRLSEVEADMEVREREKRSSDLALCDTSRQLESQRLQLIQANRWAGQAQRERIGLLWRIGHEKSTLPNCQEIEK